MFPKALLMLDSRLLPTNVRPSPHPHPLLPPLRISGELGCMRQGAILSLIRSWGAQFYHERKKKHSSHEVWRFRAPIISNGTLIIGQERVREEAL
jgi:hypothetical protein